ncbi:MAG: hypothetical protein ACREIQ_05930 [Nitrospiria bacterium]
MSITYDRRKEYFKHYYKTHKAAYLRRQQLAREKAKVDRLDEATKEANSRRALEEMEAKMWAKIQKQEAWGVKS